MRTGCRCRKTFDNITSTRLRSVVGLPWRKIEVQICVSVSQFQNRTRAPSCGSIVFVSAICLRPQERFRIDPLTELVLKLSTLVDENLPVVGEHDARALQRTRRRALEV